MKEDPYYFEIKDMVAQFIAAFDDIVIKRFNKNREIQDRLNVRYVYAPKQRVLHDLINENKTITLPVVSVNITGISRDTSRVFNKLDGFYYSSNENNELTSKHVKSPIPINLNLSVSILSRYQTDVDQIISNFVPFCNPYVVISWPLPKAFNVNVPQEIRSEVLWDSNVNISYPVELAGNQKARVTADTSFTVKGWLFKDIEDPAGNIFYIKQNFIADDLITEYESLTGTALSGHSTEFFEVSGSPFVSGIYVNGVLLQEPLLIDREENGDFVITLKGSSLSYTTGLLLSSTELSELSSVTSFSGGSRQEPISGQLLDFEILNDTSLRFNLPTDLEAAGRLTFIPFNTAGYDSSINSYLSASAPGGVEARGIKPIYIEMASGFYIQLDSAGNQLLSLSGVNNPLFFIDT